MKLTSGTVKRIHVDRQILVRNRKLGQNKPAWTIQTSKGSIKAREVNVTGHQRYVQSSKPLQCGARMYIETYAAVDYE